jgi:hypothetical protein
LRELVGRPFPLELFTRQGLRTKQVGACVFFGPFHSIHHHTTSHPNPKQKTKTKTKGGGDLPRAHARALQEGPSSFFILFYDIYT